MKKIAILMGGYSAESVISIESGQTVFKNLSREEFEAYKVQIFKDEWVLIDEKNIKHPINRHDFSVYKENQKLTFDAVFNVVHGSPGEDGRLRAYFDMIGLPCSSCDIYASILTFDKRYCLQWINTQGIATAPSYFLDYRDPFNIQKILKKVGLPCFVKPSCSGSSLGASKVYRENQLKLAVERAFKQDSETVIIESFLEGIEVSVGVVPYKNNLKVLPITELISKNDFFNYEAKYAGQSKEITPARLSEEITLKIQNIAKKIHYLLKLRGFSRSEFIIVKETPHFLEINTIPGLSHNSLIPQQAKSANIPLKDLFAEILYETLYKKTEYTFL